MTALSVIIVTRNTCQLACAAIESVLNGQDNPSREIFLVDNGSTDETPAVVAKRFPSVHLLRSDRNLGFARANNLAARQAQGQFLLLLNSDAALQPESLAAAVGWMRAHPDCGVAGVQLLNPDGSPQNSIANFPTLATELLNKSLLRRLCPRRYPGKEQRFTEPIEVETVVGACMIIRRDLWDAIGGLDERYFFFLEETDFCLQTRRLGKRLVYLPQITVWHGQGQTAKKNSPAARIEYWRSRYIYFAKNHRLSVRVALVIGLLLRLFANSLTSGLLVALTLGRSARWKNKWQVNSALSLWHLRGKPQEMGLPR
jgi:GT2 family glycosyltransferase